MDGLIRSIAPIGKRDFLLKLVIAVALAGLINHTYDLVVTPQDQRLGVFANFIRACYTAVPMCGFGLFLLTHFHQLQARLFEKSITDPLTQMRNRRWFLDKATRMPTADLTLIILDLDHFKKVNDTYGHGVGDICLQSMAKHIEDSLRNGDVCARIGGEEFAVLLADASRKQVHEIATKICLGTSVPIRDETSLRITASAGVALCGGDIPLATALQQADIALYEAKHAGRSRYHWNTVAQELPSETRDVGLRLVTGGSG